MRIPRTVHATASFFRNAANFENLSPYFLIDLNTSPVLQLLLSEG